MTLDPVVLENGCSGVSVYNQNFSGMRNVQEVWKWFRFCLSGGSSSLKEAVMNWYKTKLIKSMGRVHWPGKGDPIASTSVVKGKRNESVP